MGEESLERVKRVGYTGVQWKSSYTDDTNLRFTPKTSDPKQETYLLISPRSTDKRKFTGFLVLHGYERETCESDTVLQGY